MRRNLFGLIIILSFLVLSACEGVSPAKIKANNENMVITIKNNANFDVYGVELKIAVHSPTAVNADGSKIKKGDSLSFDLLAKDIELHGETIMESSILIKNKQLPLSINKTTIVLENNKELIYEITGDSIEEADLRRID